MSVGDNIRRCRKEKGWTQARLAQELQVSQQMIGQFEKSKNPPKIETIEKIALALSVSPIDLIGVEQWEKEKIAGLAKDGYTATFTKQEFEELQESVENGAKETLERLFYKRALEQQHKK